MRAATVLGAGELGKACAFALAASRRVAAVHLLTRDAALAGGASASAAASAAPHGEAWPWPSVVQLHEMHRLDDGSHDALRRRHPYQQGPLFLCTPCTSYLAPDDAWARAALGNAHRPATHDQLRRHRRDAAESGVGRGGFVAVFTRGFTADGAVPAELAEALLNDAADSTDAGAGGCTDTPVLVAAGPLLASEWAVQSTPAARAAAAPPRPPSALGPVHSHAATCAGPAAGSSPELLHAYSGVALTFAAWTPSVVADAGRQAALAEELQRLFARESVTYLTAPDAAAVLAIVNGCAPLCAFGGGLVSSVYAGASVTSQAAYAQHAVGATERLVNDLLGRAAGTPLPTAAVATLWSACTCMASREFALGRKLEFYFRKQDAVEAVLCGHTHHVFAATVDGLHARLQGSAVASPFYEVLMDTYNTMIRASRSGEGLVKEGYYGYRDSLPDGGGVLLREIAKVDEAMLSGDEERFTAAKKHIMEVFGGTGF